jgi:carboxyl-terminal processing protease
MKRRGTLIVAAVLGLPLVASAQFFNNFTDLSGDVLDTPAGRALLQVYGALNAGYLDEVEDNALLEGAITGMLESLEDPYTSYATPEQAAQEVENRSGSFEGIGAVLQPRNQTEGTIVEVINVYRGSPADRAGVQIGDIFVEIDGEDVRDATTDEIVSKVRGPAGTDVRLGLRRPGRAQPVMLTVTRGSIDIIDVESAVLPQNVGYVSISSFANERVFDQLDEALRSLQEQGVNSLILDLRNNGGGLLDQGIRVADEFLSDGDIVFQRARGVTQRLAEADPAAFDWPMVVLVNRNSASASEIVAGALQDNGRATVVGEKTFGKGVGQSVISLPNGGQLVYLSFEWLTPDRKSINEKGITPDVIVDDTLVPEVLALEGQGAEPGQKIEILVDGKKLGNARIDAEGNFTFVQPFDLPQDSDVQGEALVNLAGDPALRAAFNEVLEVSARAQQ